MFEAAKAKPKRTLKISEECLTSSVSKEKLGVNSTFREKGVHLLSKGKLAIVLLVEETEKQGGGYDSDLVDPESYETSPSSLLQKLLFDDQRFVKVELSFSFSFLSFSIQFYKDEKSITCMFFDENLSVICSLSLLCLLLIYCHIMSCLLSY